MPFPSKLTLDDDQLNQAVRLWLAEEVFHQDVRFRVTSVTRSYEKWEVALDSAQPEEKATSDVSAANRPS